jgi:hypothetical protein
VEYGVELGSKLGVGGFGVTVTAAGSAVIDGSLGSKVTGTISELRCMVPKVAAIKERRGP